MLMKHRWMVLLGLVALPAWGQLGETPEDCDKRYGSDLVQKAGAGGTAFTRDYTHDGFQISVRFITLSTGAKVAGWIAYRPIPGTNDTLAARIRIREAASPGWVPAEAVEITREMTPHMAEITKVHNLHIAGRRADISRVTGWTSMRCWISPTAYAADDGQNLILFSDAYLVREKTK